MQFNYNEDYVLEDDVVLLTPLLEEHVDSLLDCADHPEVWHYMLEDGRGRENLTGYVRAAVNDRMQQRAYPFAVYNKKTGQYVGSTRLYEISLLLKSLKLGHTWLGRASWGKRINQRAKYMLFEFVFDRMGMQRVGFGVSASNTRSLNALKRIGCKEEGVLRSFLPGIESPERIDLVMVGLLKEEWDGRVKEDLNHQIYS